MKKAIILLVLVMLTLVGSQAQDLNHSNRVALGYDLELNNYISPDVNVGNGLTLEYVHSFSVSKRLPLYIDFGPKLGWNYIGNVDYRAEGSDISWTRTITITIPCGCRSARPTASASRQSPWCPTRVSIWG